MSSPARAAARLLLPVVYVLVLTPLRMARRLAGRDPLFRRATPGAGTYRVARGSAPPRVEPLAAAQDLRGHALRRRKYWMLPVAALATRGAVAAEPPEEMDIYTMF